MNFGFVNTFSDDQRDCIANSLESPIEYNTGNPWPYFDNDQIMNDPLNEIQSDDYAADPLNDNNNNNGNNNNNNNNVISDGSDNDVMVTEYRADGTNPRESVYHPDGTNIHKTILIQTPTPMKRRKKRKSTPRSHVQWVSLFQFGFASFYISLKWSDPKATYLSFKSANKLQTKFVCNDVKLQVLSCLQIKHYIMDKLRWDDLKTYIQNNNKIAYILDDFQDALRDFTVNYNDALKIVRDIITQNNLLETDYIMRRQQNVKQYNIIKPTANQSPKLIDDLLHLIEPELTKEQNDEESKSMEENDTNSECISQHRVVYNEEQQNEEDTEDIEWSPKTKKIRQLQTEVNRLRVVKTRSKTKDLEQKTAIKIKDNTIGDLTKQIARFENGKMTKTQIKETMMDQSSKQIKDVIILLINLLSKEEKTTLMCSGLDDDLYSLILPSILAKHSHLIENISDLKGKRKRDFGIDKLDMKETILLQIAGISYAKHQLLNTHSKKFIRF